MSDAKRQLCLAVLLHGGRFSWKYPEAKAEGDLDLEMYKSLARTAERGCLDIIFMADGYSIKDDGLGREALRGMSTVVHFDPLSLLDVLSTVTEHIGLVCTGSTTYNHPYDWARRMASLDHMSRGRAGWNIITSQMASEAHNFGYDAPLSSEERYARAQEFLDVSLALWDSWDDDAFPRDKASGSYLDPAKMHVLDHQGRFFKVRGPLNIARMPQGYPVLCQAGESEVGREFAARYADMMYGKAGSLAHAQEFYRSMKARLGRHGRAPDELKIMPGLLCVAGRTEEEARDKFDRVQRTISEPEARDFAVQFMGPEFDLSIDRNAPLPESAELDAVASRKRIGLVRDERRLSLVELGRWIGACMGHLTLIGTPQTIVDEMERYLLEGGSDGFALMPHYLPGNLEDFVELVVPELQRRGLLRTQYAPGTLRDRLGLKRPASRYARPAPAIRPAAAIPVLDLDEATPAALVAALQANSCIFLRGGEVPVAAMQAVRRSAGTFFDLPEAEKEAVAWSGRGAWQGWQRMKQEGPGAYGGGADLVERFELRLAQRNAAEGVPDPADAAGLADWARSFTLWPRRPEGFAPLWTQTYASLHRLGSRLVGMIADQLALPPELLEAWTVRQWSNLVVNHYPPQLEPPPEGRVRSRPHTDIGGFTLLWSDDTCGGLEARIGPDRSWVPVYFPPDAILVQAGDLLTRWTAGRIPANIHRVVNPEPGSETALRGRFSVVYFHHPDMQTTITGEDGRSLVAAEHVRRRQRLETPVGA